MFHASLMRKILSIGVILFLVTTIGTAYGQQPPGENFVFDWCFGNVFADRAVWKCSWTDYFEVPLKIEDTPFIVEMEQDQSAIETFMEMQKEIANLQEPEKEPVETEAEKLGISEEAFQVLEEKREEQHGIRDKILDECIGGEEQAAAFQSRWSIEDVEKRLLSIDDWVNLTTADKKTIGECRAIGITKNWANAAYPGLEIDEPGGFKALSTEHLRTDIFATPEKMKAEEMESVKYIESMSWLRAILEEPFSSLRDPAATYQRDAAAIRHSEAEAERQQIKADEESLTQNCQMAWKMIGSGQSTPEWWPRILIDGTCDDEIDQLVELRGDYIRKEFDNQSALNCPDCKRFQ